MKTRWPAWVRNAPARTRTLEDLESGENTLCPHCKRSSLSTATLPRICPLCGGRIEKAKEKK